MRDHPAVITAARHALPGVGPVAGACDRIEPSELDEVRAFCRGDRISGLLAAAVHAGEIEVEGRDESFDPREGLHGDWHEALRACVVLEALLVRTAVVLDEQRIRWLATKGPAVGHRDFADPALRTFGDIDLIIHPDDWVRTVELLAEPGRVRPRHDRFVERYGKGLTVLVDDMEIDLHLRFAVGRFGVRCRTADCFEEPEEIRLGGRTVPVPSTHDRLLHACFHAALGGARELRAFRDVAQIALGSPRCVEPTWRTARRWGVESVVAAAIIETWARLRLPTDHDLLAQARAIPIGRADARALDVFSRHPGFRSEALTTIGALSWTERPRFVYTAWRMSREQRR